MWMLRFFPSSGTQFEVHDADLVKVCRCYAFRVLAGNFRNRIVP